MANGAWGIGVCVLGQLGVGRLEYPAVPRDLSTTRTAGEPGEMERRQGEGRGAPVIGAGAKNPENTSTIYTSCSTSLLSTDGARGP